MAETKNDTEATMPKNQKRVKPRFIVTHEYSGVMTMQEAFEQVIENRAATQMEEWADQKAV